MRYVGQSYELTVDCPRLGRAVASSAARAFHTAHAQRFVYADQNAPIEVVNLRLKAVGVSAVEQPGAAATDVVHAAGSALVAEETVMFADGPQRTQFLRRGTLPVNAVVTGPAVLLQMDATTVIPPGLGGEGRRPREPGYYARGSVESFTLRQAQGERRAIPVRPHFALASAQRASFSSSDASFRLRPSARTVDSTWVNRR